jgi:8-oxo-dGTP diphosphatase
MSDIHVLSRAIIIVDGHILLAFDPRPTPNHYYELNKQFYYLPGGHMEHQESAQQALVREIKEETGFAATVTRFLWALEHAWHFPGDEVCCHTHEINLIFEVQCAGISPDHPIPCQEEHVAFKWVRLEELLEIDLRPLPLKEKLIQWLWGRQG